MTGPDLQKWLRLNEWHDRQSGCYVLGLSDFTENVHTVPVLVALTKFGLSRIPYILKLCPCYMSHVRSSVWHLRRNLLFHLST